MKSRNMTVVLLSAMLCVSFIGFTGCGTEIPDDEIVYIQGTVYDEATGSPLSGVMVYLGELKCETEISGGYIFPNLEAGKEYHISCSVNRYETYTDTVVAIYPSSDHDINMKLLGHDESQPSPITELRLDHLRSFDFFFEHGQSKGLITITELGSYIAPDRLKAELSTSYKKDMSALSQSENGDEENRERRFCIQIGDKQWLDFGEGYFKNTDKKHMGFEHVFEGIYDATERARQALKTSNYVSDLGLFTIGSREVRRLETLTVVPEMTNLGGEEVEQKLLIDLTAFVCVEEGDLNGVPIDVEISVFQSAHKIRTYSHFRLSNINVDFNIDPPTEGERGIDNI